MILGNEHNQKLLEIAVEASLPVLLIGETGSGKTSLIRELGQQHGHTVIRFNMTGETSVDEFVGKYILEDNKTKWEDGILLQAIKRGHWLVVDEVNVALPEILFVLHSLLDDDRAVMVAHHQGEVVRPHQNFRFFATMNPVDEYAGTKDLNKAFSSRFGMVLHIEYPEPKVEKTVVEASGISSDQAAQIVDVGVALRRAKAEGQLFYTCSTRDLLQWAALVPRLGLQGAFDASVVGKAMTERDKLKQVFQSVVGRYEAIPRDEESLIEWVEASLEKIERKTADLRREILEEIQAKLSEKPKKAVKARA